MSSAARELASQIGLTLLGNIYLCCNKKNICIKSSNNFFTGITDIFDRMLSNPLVLAPATIIVGLTYANHIMNLTMESNFPIISNTSNQWGIIIL